MSFKEYFIDDEYEPDDGVEPFEFLSPAECERPYTVSEINNGVATILEEGNTVIWVQGELSTFKRGPSGHCYFRIKDEQCQVPAVIWRSNAEQLTFKPEDGLEIVGIASLRVYRKGGYYQLDVHKMQPAGLGVAHAAFLKLKEKLDKEGLFATERKRPLPDSVNVVGVVTAKTGAAIRDIIKVIRSRSPQTTILLYDATVQGARAPQDISEGIAALNIDGRADVLIVGRGGGSAEDLIAFNDEQVARAIVGSKIPVISAVGHEIDVTIADLVADLRAATPSVAAEMAVPDREADRRYYDQAAARFVERMHSIVILSRREYSRLITRVGLKMPFRQTKEMRQNLDDLRDRGERAIRLLMEQHRTRLTHAGQQLNSVSPLSVLTRGYSVVQKADGQTVTDASSIAIDEDVTLRFLKGSARAQIRSISLTKK